MTFYPDDYFSEAKPQTTNPIVRKTFKVGYAVIIFLAILLLTCGKSYSQKTEKPKVDSAALLQAEWGKYIDSVLSKTSIKDFDDWIRGVATVKQYPDTKFVDAVNAFIQQQQQMFLSKRQKK